MRYGFPLLLISLVLLFTTFLEASEKMPTSDLTAEKADEAQMRFEFGYGFESNVFYSKSHPQSDSFILPEAFITVSTKPTTNSLFLVDFFGSYQHFLRFDKADRLLTDLVLDYQYSTTPSTGIGLSNTLSYANLKLFDTEGNTLPMEKFSSLSERVRFYGFFYPSQSLDFELGGSYRMVNNMEETDDAASLNFNKIAADLSSRYFFSPLFSARLKYEYSVQNYDDLQALNRDSSFNGLVDPTNPKLRMKRHEISLNLKYKGSSYLDLEVTGKLSINDDQFEEDLSYRQGEIRGKATMRDLKIVTPAIELYYMNRRSTDRRKELGSYETLKEEFLIGNIDLIRNLKKWLEIYLRYQWIHQTTNAPFSGFDDHIALLGLRLIR